MSVTVILNDSGVVKRRASEIRKKVEERKKYLKSIGAKSFEAVFVEDGKAKSDVRG